MKKEIQNTNEMAKFIRNKNGRNNYYKIIHRGAEYKFDYNLLTCFVFAKGDVFPSTVKPYNFKITMLREIKALVSKVI